jgi:hypothetical protein
VPVAPAASRGRIENTRVSHHGRTGNRPAFPHANGFNGFLRALSGDRAFLPPSPRNAEALSRVDASVEASGPHDFAVRLTRVRLARLKRPPHPALHVRDDRERPLSGRDGIGSIPVSTNSKSEKFFARGLDSMQIRSNGGCANYDWMSK